MVDILNIEAHIRLLLTRNGEKLLDFPHTTAAETYVRQANDRLQLAKNQVAFQTIDLNDIGVTNPGQHLFVRAERPITIAINTTAKEVVADTLVVLGSSITALFFKNTDVDNTTDVEFLVTD